MTLRPAHVAEADALSALAVRSKAHWGYSSEFMAACRDELEVHVRDIAASRVTVAEGVGGILGFYWLGPVRAGSCELEALFVEPAAIGQGVGRALLDAAARAAHAEGARSLTIQADPNAEAFYLRAGARRVGERASGSIPGRMLPLLALDLGETDSAGTVDNGSVDQHV